MPNRVIEFHDSTFDNRSSWQTEPLAAYSRQWERAMKSFVCLCWSSLAATFLVTLFAPLGTSQEHSKYKTLTSAQVQEMLDKIEVDIKEYYYDPRLNGLDLDKRFESARQKIAAAQSQNEALLYVAGAVAALDDSHTRFLPPPAPYGVEYGWRMQAVGDPIVTSRRFAQTAMLPQKDSNQAIKSNQ